MVRLIPPPSAPPRPGPPRRSTPAWFRKATTAAAGLGLLLASTACSSDPVAGEAYPDWDAVQVSSSEAFDVQLGKLAAVREQENPYTTDASVDIVGISYSHMQQGDTVLGAKNTVTVKGNPISLFIQKVDPGDGKTIDNLHIGGSEWDYLLLGPGFMSASDTRWVRYPTLQESASSRTEGSLCGKIGFSTACELPTAIDLTAATGAEVRKAVTINADGSSFIQTEVTLSSIMETELYLLPTDTEAALPESMRSGLIPVSLWQDPEGRLVKIEINGIVAGTDGAEDLAVQLGFEIIGGSSTSDFPDAPPDSEVTTLTSDELGDFLAGLENV